ncbi:transposase [Sellimonas intestinalis]|nr:transposase [Sellimonas intestinalis]NSK29123.1 transposase [Sellimonas intestinalis]NSK46183.1 transposase [Sellimonas intestinalis]NSK52802.1 transposase [Sellimonas intestinalis]NSK62855.1 transposase [Sellimonas intestinalis]
MRTYHYSVGIGHGKATFPTVALGSLRGSLAFFWKGHGVQFPWLATSQTYLSALFSFQRTIGYSAYQNQF